MMTANQRALKKTIIAVLLIAIFIVASNIWPPLAGYAVTAVIVSAIVGLIFMAFAMYEETQEWRKRD